MRPVYSDEDVAVAKQAFGELLMVLRSGRAVTPRTR